MRLSRPSLVGVLVLLAWPGVAEAANLFTTVGITRSETRQNSEINGNPPYSLPAEEMPASGSVDVPPGDAQDDVPLRMPDTTGTKPNFAAFRGQILTLAPEQQKGYQRIHFFGTTADGSGGGTFVLHYSDDSTQNVDVSFPDWCGNGSPSHFAIGPLSQRYRVTGGDTARCGIFHVTADGTPGKTLTAVQLPPATAGSGGATQAYLMSLTLEAPDGTFVEPDLSGRLNFPNDHAAPVTTAKLQPGAPNGGEGWYRGAPQVTLEAEDEAGGSGVDQIQYRIDGGNVQLYGRPFAFPVEGDHTLEYRSIDGVGNTEDFKSLDLKVDATAPTTIATTPDDQTVADWHDGAVTVSLSATDGAGSGAKVTHYRVDGGAWRVYGAPFAVADQGVHAVEYASEDVAGNKEEAGALAVRVDATAPVTTPLVNGAPPVSTYAGPVRIVFTRSDGEGSGAAGTEYRIAGSGWAQYSGALDFSALGGYRIDYRTRDVAGNVENYRSLLFAITAPLLATTAPVLPAAAPRPAPYASFEPAKPRNGRVRVRITCSGVDRGLVKLSIRRADMRRLKLKTRTLAQRGARCREQGRATVTLTPSARIRRALAKSKRTVRATLTLRFTGAATDRQTVTFRGKS